MSAHVIYKYILPSDQGLVDLNMPEGATILHVDSVNDSVVLWARVKPMAPFVKRRLSVIGQGVPFDVDTALGLFVGVAVTLNGLAPWFVFDLGTD
jgi:hypothetical protein